MSQGAKQRGAAVVMALFVVVLCTLSVSPLIWNLFATAKTISVGAARGQATQVSYSAVDWARVILREDGRVSTTDTLNEPWAVPLADSRLDESLMRKGQSPTENLGREAILAGRIEDAQGRFNLRNLGLDHGRTQVWAEAFVKLCELLNVNAEQQQLVVEAMGRMHPLPKAMEEPPGAAKPLQQSVAARSWEEFRGTFGITQETWTQLRPYVAILPAVTTVNANTASAEVLYATLAQIAYSDAQALVSRRERTTFLNLADVQAALLANQQANSDLIDVQSSYFLVEGTAQVDQALIRTQALLERKNQKVYVLWRQ